MDHRGQEDQRRGDSLAPRAEVLADEGFGEAEAVREDDRFLILFEELGVVARGMVEGHREHAEPDGHGALLSLREAITGIGMTYNPPNLSKRSPTPWP